MKRYLREEGDERLRKEEQTGQVDARERVGALETSLLSSFYYPLPFLQAFLWIRTRYSGLIRKKELAG